MFYVFVSNFWKCLHFLSVCLFLFLGGNKLWKQSFRNTFCTFIQETVLQTVDPLIIFAEVSLRYLRAGERPSSAVRALLEDLFMCESQELENTWPCVRWRFTLAVRTWMKLYYRCLKISGVDKGLALFCYYTHLQKGLFKTSPGKQTMNYFI